MPAIASLLPGLTPPVQPLAPIATGEALPGFADLFGNAATVGGKALPVAETPTRAGKHPAREVLPAQSETDASSTAEALTGDTVPPGEAEAKALPKAATSSAPVVFTPILGMTWIVPKATSAPAQAKVVHDRTTTPPTGATATASLRSFTPAPEGDPLSSPPERDRSDLTPSDALPADRFAAVTPQPPTVVLASTPMVIEPRPIAVSAVDVPALVRASTTGIAAVPIAPREAATPQAPLASVAPSITWSAPTRTASAPSSERSAQVESNLQPSPIAPQRPPAGPIASIATPDQSKPAPLHAPAEALGAKTAVTHVAVPPTVATTSTPAQLLHPVSAAAPASATIGVAPVAQTSRPLTRREPSIAEGVTIEPGDTSQPAPIRFTAQPAGPAPLAVTVHAVAQTKPTPTTPVAAQGTPAPQPRVEPASTPVATLAVAPGTTPAVASQPLAAQPLTPVASAPMPPAPAGKSDASTAGDRPARPTLAQPLAPARAPATDTAALLDARPAAPSRTVSAAAQPAERIDPPVASPLAAPVAAPVRTDTPQPPLDLTRHAWPTQMVDRIERLRDAAEAVSTSIRVIPDALGAIDVSVKKEGEVTHVHLAADQPQTRALLAEAAPKLAELAEARGIKLGQSEVGGGSASTGGGQQSASQQQTARQPTTPVRAVRPERSAPDDSRIA